MCTALPHTPTLLHCGPHVSVSASVSTYMLLFVRLPSMLRLGLKLLLRCSTSAYDSLAETLPCLPTARHLKRFKNFLGTNEVGPLPSMCEAMAHTVRKMQQTSTGEEDWGWERHVILAFDSMHVSGGQYEPSMNPLHPYPCPVFFCAILLANQEERQDKAKALSYISSCACRPLGAHLGG